MHRQELLLEAREQEEEAQGAVGSTQANLDRYEHIPESWWDAQDMEEGPAPDRMEFNPLYREIQLALHQRRQ